MAEKLDIKTHDDHIDQLTAMRKRYGEARGTSKTPDGYRVPDTTVDDVKQLAAWWHAEYARARLAKAWNRDPAQKIWEANVKRVAAETRNSEPEEVFRNNHWFWNKAVLKLAIYLQAEKSKPSPMSLFLESLEEAVDDRIKDARNLVEGAGDVVGDALSAASKAAEAIGDAGERAWSGVKIAAIIGGSLLGAAVVLPPVIRAMRD